MSCRCIADNTPLPLKDGQVFKRADGTEDIVEGEIKMAHDVPICWTRRGDWYRRSDGKAMTGAGDVVQPVQEFYRKRSGRVVFET